MTYYFAYLGAVLKTFGKSVADFFSGHPMSFKDQQLAYGSAFNTYSVGFSAGGWIMYVLMILLFAALLTGIVLIIIYIIRRILEHRAIKKGANEEK